MRLNLFLILLVLFSELFGQSERETRAVWVATNFHLDWPSLSYNEQTQKVELKTILYNIKSKNLNTVYFQVRSQGTVLFNSDYEPTPDFLTGNFGDKINYDPLEYAIKTAHKDGLEIHAWVNVFRCLSNSNLSAAQNKWHVMYSHPEWVVKNWDNNSVSYWLDPGLPDVREYLIDVISEVAIKYKDIDGIHLDFVRYPGKKFADSKTYNKYGGGLSLEDWRRNNINEFVERLKIQLNRINSQIKLGAAPIGIYQNLDNAVGFEGRNDVYQDSRLWVEKGWLDYVVPQIYWPEEDNPSYNSLVKDWISSTLNRNTIIGIGAYKPEVANEIVDQINLARNLGADGVAFYRYSNIKSLNLEIFNTKTLPSEMGWIESDLPSAPENLSVKYIDSNDEFILNWNYPDEKNNQKYISLYNVKNNKRILYDVFETDRRSVKIKIINPKYLNYKFYIKSLNHNWIESKDSSNIVDVKMKGINDILKIIERNDQPKIINIQNDKAGLLIYSKIKELIQLEFISKHNKSETINELLKVGENIILLDKNLSNFKEIVIDFKSTGKVSRLLLNN